MLTCTDQLTAHSVSSAGQQAAILKSLAETFRIAVVVVNQVTAQMHAPTSHAFQGNTGANTRQQDSHLTAALGTMWAHAVNTRLVLESAAEVRYIKVSSRLYIAAIARAVCSKASGLLPCRAAPHKCKITCKGLS